MLVFMMVVPAASMAAPVPLGAASGFAVLAGTTVTNTGTTWIGGSAGGDLGVSPGSAFSDLGHVTLANGALHLADAVSLLAQNDLIAAYDNAFARPTTQDLSGQDLGAGRTLTPGVYEFTSSAQLSGDLTLDAQGDPDGVFVFKIASALTTASGSRVLLTNGARYCRVFWQVGSSAAELGTNSQFVGHIFALTSIAAKTGATVQGQLLARNGAVTLDSNRITNGICVTGRAINVQKTASPTALPSGPGSVTYTYEVTNPGTVVLGGVTVNDDKLGPITYRSGDANTNGLLDLNETWIYTATTTLNATTANTATAAGSEGGVTTTDTSLVTVVVAGRLLPNTATPWYTVLLAGVVLTLLGAAGYWMTTRKIHA
jgi:hypothetical protein